MKLSEHVQTLIEDDKPRIHYIGGGSYVVSVPQSLATDLESKYPKSFKKGRQEGTLVTYYCTERGAQIAGQYLKGKGQAYGGSPMYDLAPGEMPSW